MGFARVIVPRLLAPAVAFGLSKLTMLNAFLASRRPWRVKRSRNLKSRKTAKSTFRNPGPSRKLRGELPSMGAPGVAGFCRNAEVLNQQPDVPTGDPTVPGGDPARGGQFPLRGSSPVSEARSVVTASRLASVPFRTVNGWPLRSVTIGESDHPLRTPRS